MLENQQVVEINQGMEKLAEKEEQEQEERKIPVFTVLKNSFILKNIYLIDTPPPPPASSSSNLVEKDATVADKQEYEENLVVGRHPDCSITLEHPSISRFHLRIHSIPSQQSLYVIDLSSVHGTWVCGKKIAPGVPVELHDGDVLQLGGSSRIYRLHWIPLSQAYDYDNPIVPMIKGPDNVEEKNEMQQDAEELSLQNDHQIEMEAEDLLFTDKNIMSEIKQLTPSAPPMPEDIESPFSSEEEAENKSHLDEDRLSLQHDESQIDYDLDGLDLLFSDITEVTEKASLSSSASLLHEDMESPVSFDEEAENKNAGCPSEIADLHPVFQVHEVNSIPDVAIDSENSMHEISESLRPHVGSGTSIWSRRGKSASVSVSVKTSRARESSDKKNGVDFEVKSESNENIRVELVSEGPFPCEDNTVIEVFPPDKENCTPLNLLLNKSRKKLGQEKGKDELSVHSMVSSMDEDKEDSFTPDKENITPNTLLYKKLDYIRCSKTYKSSPLKNASPGIHQDVDKPGSSSKENHVKKLLQDKKPGRSVLKTQADRIPFQPLLKSPNCSGPETTKSKAAIINSCSPIKNQQIKEPIYPFNNLQEIPKEENKNWIMVVDAGCLLNKESRKALQLMQGLPGTSLIIPRIVIRELDCMKKRGNLFRRNPVVCSALEWIEQCMINARSWIHVQSSLEDLRPTATTPPATPLFNTREVEKTQKFSFSSVPFSPRGGGSWLDILSPTTEDHILECALFFRRIKSNGHLVLLSTDVTLKIKAMAEGLLCETAEEFRQSLVNPFSERFLWTDSSPRGPTWSCVDDVVLREKYYNNPPIHKQSKSGEATKGLKLILHHNSHFRHISSAR